MWSPMVPRWGPQVSVVPEFLGEILKFVVRPREARFNWIFQMNPKTIIPDKTHPMTIDHTAHGW